MIVKRIELSGYKRFKLSSVHKLELTASSAMQLIIGTNGSGKSSLLEALSPFPQPTTDYEKGGYKILEITHNGINYVLEARYSGTGKFSFIREGEELNSGGTATVQRDLAEKEFGYGNKLHNLATGKVKFTDMSPNQRREWLTYISPLDMEYALGVHKDIKTRLRDAQGALKLTEERLVAESRLLLDKDVLKSINDRVEVLNNVIAFHGSQVDTTVKVAMAKDLNGLSEKIIRLSRSITGVRFNIRDTFGIKSIEELTSRLNKINNDIQINRSMVSEYEGILEETNDVLKQLEDEGAIDLAGLEAKLAVLHEALEKSSELSGLFNIEGDVLTTLKESKSLSIMLSEFVSNLSGTMRPIPEKSNWKKLKAELHDVKEEIHSTENTLARLLQREQELSTAKDMQCPKCKYIWIPGVSENDLKKVKHSIEVVSDRLNVLHEKLPELNQKVEDINAREAEIASLSSMASSYPRLRPLWAYVIDNDYISSGTSLIMEAFSIWVGDLEKAHGKHNLLAEIKAVEAAIARVKSIGDKADISMFRSRKTETEKKISKTRAKLDGLIHQEKELSGYNLIYKKMVSHIADLACMVDEYYTTMLNVHKTNVQKFNRDCMSKAQMELASAGRKTVEAETAIGVVKDLKEYICKLKSDITALKVLESSLSPVEGLIADNMFGFINGFIGQINNIISEIWEYNLTVVSCGLDGSDLDYKFPLSYDCESGGVKDIAEGSTGQKEIVNFAFMLTVMAYLGANEYPLFLDEVGGGFDELHRKKLIHFIKCLLDVQKCPQLWIVSHFAAEHGGLNNAEICVLNETNIVTPSTYNQHVTIQ